MAKKDPSLMTQDELKRLNKKRNTSPRRVAGSLRDTPPAPGKESESVMSVDEEKRMRELKAKRSAAAKKGAETRRRNREAKIAAEKARVSRDEIHPDGPFSEADIDRMVGGQEPESPLRRTVPTPNQEVDDLAAETGTPRNQHPPMTPGPEPEYKYFKPQAGGGSELQFDDDDPRFGNVDQQPNTLRRPAPTKAPLSDQERLTRHQAFNAETHGVNTGPRTATIRAPERGSDPRSYGVTGGNDTSIRTAPEITAPEVDETGVVNRPTDVVDPEQRAELQKIRAEASAKKQAAATLEQRIAKIDQRLKSLQGKGQDVNVQPLINRLNAQKADLSVERDALLNQKDALSESYNQQRKGATQSPGQRGAEVVSDAIDDPKGTARRTAEKTGEVVSETVDTIKEKAPEVAKTATEKVAEAEKKATDIIEAARNKLAPSRTPAAAPEFGAGFSPSPGLTKGTEVAAKATGKLMARLAPLVSPFLMGRTADAAGRQAGHAETMRTKVRPSSQEQQAVFNQMLQVVREEGEAIQDPQEHAAYFDNAMAEINAVFDSMNRGASVNPADRASGEAPGLPFGFVRPFEGFTGVGRGPRAEGAPDMSPVATGLSSFAAGAAGIDTENNQEASLGNLAGNYGDAFSALNESIREKGFGETAAEIGRGLRDDITFTTDRLTGKTRPGFPAVAAGGVGNTPAAVGSGAAGANPPPPGTTFVPMDDRIDFRLQTPDGARGTITPPMDPRGLRGGFAPSDADRLPGDFASRVQASIDAGAYDPVSQERFDAATEVANRIPGQIAGLRGLRAAQMGVPASMVNEVAAGNISEEDAVLTAQGDAKAAKGQGGLTTKQLAELTMKMDKEQRQAIMDQTKQYAAAVDNTGWSEPRKRKVKGYINWHLRNAPDGAMMTDADVATFDMDLRFREAFHGTGLWSFLTEWGGGQDPFRLLHPGVTLFDQIQRPAPGSRWLWNGDNLILEAGGKRFVADWDDFDKDIQAELKPILMKKDEEERRKLARQ